MTKSIDKWKSDLALLINWFDLWESIEKPVKFRLLLRWSRKLFNVEQSLFFNEILDNSTGFQYEEDFSDATKTDSWTEVKKSKSELVFFRRNEKKINEKKEF